MAKHAPHSRKLLHRDFKFVGSSFYLTARILHPTQVLAFDLSRLQGSCVKSCHPFQPPLSEFGWGTLFLEEGLYFCMRLLGSLLALNDAFLKLSFFDCRAFF